MYVQLTNDAAPTSATEIFDFGENLQYDSIDGGQCVLTQNWGSFYQWNRLNNRGTDINGCSGVGAERLLALNSGANTVTFWGREVAARVDYVILTTDMTYNPNSSFQPTPTPGPSACGRRFLCRNRPPVLVYQPCNSIPVSPCSN
jgi:hypothetical protein